MASLTVNATGHSEALITGGFQSLISIQAQLTVSTPQVQFLSAGVPRRVMHAGWYGVGFAPAAGINRMMLWWKYLEMEREAFYYTPLMSVDRMIWNVAPGVTVQLVATW